MISGIPITSQPLCNEFGGEVSLDRTRKVGNSTDCTRSSGCLAKVENKSRSNHPSPDSLGMYPTWIVTQVDQYQSYWDFENSSNYQPEL